MIIMELRVDEDGVIHGPFLRTKYNYDMNFASKRAGLSCTDASRAQQQFADECNINTIVERFGITGQLPQDLRMPLNEEFLEVWDYQSALNKLMEAESAFMQMPADIRAQFQNDAGKFVDFVTNKENLDQCRKWGLAVPEAVKAEPMSVRVIADEPASGGTGSA